MLQGGFGQAQQAAGQAYGQQMGLGQAHRSPGPTTIRNRTISTRTCRFSTTIIRTRYSGLWSSGRTTTSICTGRSRCSREAARMEAYEPYERLGYLGTGITGMLGGYPGQYQSQITPNPTPLQSALGIGTGLAGMYGAYNKISEDHR